MESPKIKNPNFENAVAVMNRIYGNLDARRVSLDERKRLNLDNDCFVYGEITYDTFTTMLDIADPKPGEVFYDLGSGSGKAVMMAALLGDFSKACGVELLDALHKLSADQLEKFNQDPRPEFNGKQFNISYLHDDLFKQDISDADIVYINATCFIGDIWEKTVNKLNQELRTGGRVMLCTKSLPSTHYQQLYSQLMEMSWGPCTINVFKKIV
ncbi:MAG: hypothetical protein KIT27_11815 [Legionellales bacterium]|nr:hypothetical protein [Legionellales bacterium]